MPALKPSATGNVEIDQIAAAINNSLSLLNGPDLMSLAVDPTAREWVANIRNGGGVGVPPYARLSAQTKRIRELRGHNDPRPILASGALFRSAIGGFVGWRKGETHYTQPVPRTTPDIPEAQSGESLVVGVVTPRRFKATITGAKAIHQTGGPMGFFGHHTLQTFVPARPFWVLTDKGMDDAANAMMAYLVNTGLYGLPNFSGYVTRVLPGSRGPTFTGLQIGGRFGVRR